ncbi:MAG: twin-arginine translocase subunit TatC [Gammaproteobacteria bacterium]|jgi:sec-independent protein translocase protein TatC|nr:twin-arginine translocase subunit TatC [Chromatiales bacterium]MCP4924446.1 twin-arginine translocase subunit TatC [Gammaproteobacteria bacterium]MDP7153727.1 twin-arginine translocase subunit TatC [Gammaproteobacteria bacterium]MDP7296746.1 twin-arginine translocase subunit TatC [Gammaproteobacteria bacterium]MDP7419198.1 twin-arginine translocase subunit TatC [Gammaproteobacteria bacterium]
MTDSNGNHEPDSADSSAETEEQLEEGSLISHLIELRSRMVKASAAVLAIFICLVPFAQQIFTMVADPLIDQLPEGSTMIATQVASPFLTPFKTTLFVALFFAMPVVIYQIWSFVAPGLYRKEKTFAIPLVTSSIVLFYLGIAFAYFVVFPLMFAFFNSVTPDGVQMMTDISSYLDFILTIFFAFGLAFEVPIATVMLVATGMTTTASLKKKRPFVFLGAFVVGMFLTPPDVISQTLLAVPIYVLFEAGILMSRLMLNSKTDRDIAGDEPA